MRSQVAFFLISSATSFLFGNITLTLSSFCITSLRAEGIGMLLSNALSTDSLNFAGWAVPREMTVSPASKKFCATLTPIALWGHKITPFLDKTDLL